MIANTEGGQRLAAIVPESMLGALGDAEDAEDAAEADAAWDDLAARSHLASGCWAGARLFCHK